MTGTRQETVVLTPPGDDHVGIVEMQRPPNNYLDIHVLRELIDALGQLDADPRCRAVVVQSRGKHFCAGRDFTATRSPDDTSAAIYSTAQALVEKRTPWVAALQGGSIGAGMGLALCADYRVAAESAYLSANFVRLGLHHGFGMSATLPRLVGPHRSAELLSTGRRVGAPEALRLGLVDDVAAPEEVVSAARRLAAALAEQPPLALTAIRATLRADLSVAFAAAVEHELTEQTALMQTNDFREAAAAMRERRPPQFTAS
ncbi:enoyl-CoA hydratase/isomerase family protein [Rhodococcus koreensis]